MLSGYEVGDPPITILNLRIFRVWVGEKSKGPRIKNNDHLSVKIFNPAGRESSMAFFSSSNDACWSSPLAAAFMK